MMVIHAMPAYEKKGRIQTHGQTQWRPLLVAVCAGRFVLVCLLCFMSHTQFQYEFLLTQISEQTEVEPETVKVHNYSFIYF